MQLLGYLASVAIGISLGLFGGGGSILTLPVLVYLFGVGPVQATLYSMFAVGLTSLFGSIESYMAGMVKFKSAAVLGIASLVTVLTVRRFVIPLVPQRIALTSGLSFTLASAEMICFSILATAVGMVMILPERSLKILSEDGVEQKKTL